MKPLWRFTGVCIAALLTLILVVAGVQAGGILFWSTGGVPIVVRPYEQLNARAVSDDASGAIIVWQDFRSGVDNDIYAQHVSSSGRVQWAANGMSVSAASNDQSNPVLTGDGLEGAIVAWQDKRNGSDYNIFAQRISSNGLAMWNMNGITICSALDKQDVPQIASDHQGGAIVVWEDYRSGNHWDVYAQRIAPNGQSLWAANGITLGLVNSQLAQPLPKIVEDGENGAFVAWMVGPSPDSNIAVQHVLSDGTKLWASDGITLTSTGTAVYPQVTPDGNGGVIVAWQSSAGVFAQHVQSNGTVLWGTGGIKLMGGGLNPGLVGDNAQGAFVAWQAYPNGYAAGSDIFAQRVLSDGTQLWGGEGITITAAPGHQQVPRVVGDGYDGAIVVWQDSPSSGSLPDYSLWAQRVNSAGVTQWITNGVMMITGTNSQLADVTSDQLHGGIVTWIDRRNDSGDVYAQHIADFTATTWVYLPMVRK